MGRIKNNQYDKFQVALNESDTNKDGWRGLKFTGLGPAYDLWESMSERSKGKVASDSRWNHYPIYSYTQTSKKRFGYVIGRLVNRALKAQCESQLRTLTNKSEGVFAIHMIDNSPAYIRIKMAKRLYCSPDPRVRTRCARILPVKYLTQMLDDKSYSVRSVALTRIGMDNCYKSFLPSTLAPQDKSGSYWYNSWLSRQALRLGEKKDLLGLIEEAKGIEISKANLGSMDVVLAALIGRMTQEEALFLMGLGRDNVYIRRALEAKMGWDD